MKEIFVIFFCHRELTFRGEICSRCDKFVLFLSPTYFFTVYSYIFKSVIHNTDSLRVPLHHSYIFKSSKTMFRKF